jgi:hypothetical protein
MSANAGDTIAFTSEGFMRKTYGDDWAEFAVAPDLLVLVKECFLISELVVHFEPRGSHASKEVVQSIDI